MYAGLDSLTGERMHLRESTTDPAEAERIRTKFLSQVDDGRNAKTRAALGTALVGVRSAPRSASATDRSDMSDSVTGRRRVRWIRV